jgi:hypothetical protein
MQRNFEPMRKQVEAWQRSELTDVTSESCHLRGLGRGQAGSTEASRPNSARSVLRAEVRGISVTNNLVTSAFKELEPIPQFKVTSKTARAFSERAGSGSAVLTVVDKSGPQTVKKPHWLAGT